MTTVPHDAQPTFEATYPKAPFADLIRLTLSLTGAVVKLRARLAERAPTGIGPRPHA